MTRRGFTLIEMLVSLAIFVIVTAFVTANFRAGRQSDELRIASQLAASSLRRAQSFALAGQTTTFCRGGANDLRECLGGTDVECVGGACVREVPHGYGVHFSTVDPARQRIVFFADTNGNHAYDDGEAIRSDAVSPGTSVVVNTVNPSATGVLDVVFDPPNPTVYFNGGTATPIASVTVRHLATGQMKTVTVNALSGQINAD